MIGAAFRISTNISNSSPSAGVFLGFGQVLPGTIKQTLGSQTDWITTFFSHLEMIDIWLFPKIVGSPKSSILIGFSLVNHPFWGTTIFGNSHIDSWKLQHLKWRSPCDLPFLRACFQWVGEDYTVMAHILNLHGKDHRKLHGSTGIMFFLGKQATSSSPSWHKNWSEVIVISP